MKPTEMVRKFKLWRGRKRRAKKAKTMLEVSSYLRWREREQRKRNARSAE